MRRDLLLISGGFIAIGLVSWTFWGNPELRTPRMHTAQPLNADPDLLLVNLNSPYVRTER
jgi:hypothetical protein